MLNAGRTSDGLNWYGHKPETFNNQSVFVIKKFMKLNTRRRYDFP